MDLIKIIILAIFGMFFGFSFAWILSKARFIKKISTLEERQKINDELIESLQEKNRKLDENNLKVQFECNNLKNLNSSIEARLEEEKKQIGEKLTLLRDFNEYSKNSLKEEFKNLSTIILEEKTKKFEKQNIENLGGILSPFKDRLNEFKSRVEEIHLYDIKQIESLKGELKNLKDLNSQMSNEAKNLANALKGQSKAQGNWGELVLENVLSRSGLELNKEYKREVSFVNEKGKQRPDVIVYLPEGKHLIIDAKVSLNAYTRFVNSDNDLESKVALKEHVLAISERLGELAQRKYFEINDLNSPEFVFMFIPIESAFAEAMKADENLFQKAIEQNILVATPTTLLTSLKIVSQLWRFENQNSHTALLAESAGKIHSKLETILSSMLDLGKKLNAANESYELALNRFTEGPGNLVKKIKDFEKLGISVKKELPKHIVEKAELELKSPKTLRGEKE